MSHRRLTTASTRELGRIRQALAQLPDVYVDEEVDESGNPRGLARRAAPAAPPTEDDADA